MYCPLTVARRVYKVGCQHKLKSLKKQGTERTCGKDDSQSKLDFIKGSRCKPQPKRALAHTCACACVHTHITHK